MERVLVSFFTGPGEDDFVYDLLDRENPVGRVRESFFVLGYNNRTGRGVYSVKSILSVDREEVLLKYVPVERPAENFVQGVPVNDKLQIVFPSLIEQGGVQYPRIEILPRGLPKDPPRVERTVTADFSEHVERN